MLFIFASCAACLLAAPCCWPACKKDDTTAGRARAHPGFTVTLNTSQYPVVATFTNTSTDGFLYQWDFGDGSPLASGQNVTHT